MSEQSLQLLQRIRQRLADTARRITTADLLFGLAVLLGIVSAVWIVSVGVEAGFRLGTAARTALFWTLASVFAGILGYFVILPLLRLAGVLPGPSTNLVAHRIGMHFPEVGDRLVNLLDLSEGRRTDAPDGLVDGAVQMLGRQVEPISFENVETYSRPRRAVRIAAIPVAALVLFVTAAPGMFVDASKRLLSPGTHFQAPAPFTLIVEPGNQDLAKGSAMEISVRAEGESTPSSVTLLVQNADEDHVEEIRLTADSMGTFRHSIANVRRPFRYRASAERVSTEWYQTNVTEHPLVRSLQVTLEFPAYSGIPPQRLDPNVGDIAGLAGTTVQIDAVVGGSEAEEASVLFDSGETADLELSGDHARGEFRLTREGTYRIVLLAAQGIQNRDPISYSMDLISDSPPSVVLIHPEPDAVLADDLRSLLVARLGDDFGFRDLRLHYRLAESRFGDPTESFTQLSMPLEDPRQLDQEVRFDWDVSESTDLDPVPGDVIEYFVEVRDNDAYSGFKSARSAVQRLRLPSLAEKYEELDREQDEIESQMEDMQRQADEVREQFEELSEEIRRKRDGDWEDKRQIEQLQERQSRLEDHAQQLSEQIESATRSMEQNDLLSEETLEMYQELQNVVEEINSPELMDALRQLQQAVEELDLEQMQQSLEDFEFSEDQYRQRLERSLELFKNLRTQQGLEEAARRAEEIAEQQKRLAEETKKLQDQETENDAEDSDDGNQEAESRQSDDDTSEEDDAGTSEDQASEDQASEEEQPSNEDDRSDDRTSGDREDGSDDQESRQQQNQQNPDSESLAKQQERSKEEMEQLEQLLDELREQMDELKRGPKDKMQELNESVRREQLPQKMQDNAEQLRRQEMQDAQQGQQQMQQQLQQLQSQLSQMQQGMQGQQMQVNMAGLRRALSDVLTLSQEQEELRAGVRNTVSETPSLREDARSQVELSEGLSTVSDSLQRLSKNIPQMSREVQRHAGLALREMGNATEAMTERSVGDASGYQKASMMHLNELALMLSEVLKQLMNSAGSGGGGASLQQMIQQMQQMSGQQQKLNEQIQQFLNDAQGNRLGVDMQQRLQQMGRQQRAIQKQLDELRRNPEARGKLLGDLDKISRQMEETIRELEQRQVEPKMIERQRQILQRLLDAQRSMNQRGKEDRRESQEGRDVTRQSPADLPPEEAADKLRRDLIEALDSGYAPDYEELIKRYFELLQEQTLEQE